MNGREISIFSPGSGGMVKQQTISIVKTENGICEIACIYFTLAEDCKIWNSLAEIYKTLEVDTLYIKAGFSRAGYYTERTWEIIGNAFAGKVKIWKSMRVIRTCS